MATTLRARLLGAFLLLALLPLAVAGGLVYRRGEAILVGEVEARLATAALLKSQQIQSWIEERKAAVVRPASLPTFQRRLAALLGRRGPAAAGEAARDLRDNLERLRRTSGFTEMFLVEPVDGRVVLSTDPGQEGKVKKDRPYFREARTAPFVQHVYYSLTLGRAVMTFSAPVPAHGGGTAAILVGRADLQFLDRLMGERAGLGRTGQTFLVNRFNYFVSESLGRDEHGRRPVFSDGVKRALAGQTGTGRYVSHTGRPVLAAYRWVPEIGLALVAEMDADEALRPVRSFLWALVTVAGLVGAFAVVVGAGLSYGVTRPVRRLAAAAAALGRGEFGQRVEEEGSSELRLLARSFNTMADGLGRLQEALRLQVEDRTQELRALNELAAATAGAETVEALLEAALDRILGLLDREVGLAFLRADGGHLRLVAHRGLPSDLAAELEREPLEVGEGILGGVVASGRRVLLDEGAGDARVGRVSVGALGLRSFAGVPLRAKAGVVGVLGIGGRQTAPIPGDRLAFLEALGHQLGAVVETLRLTERATARSRELEALAAITRELTGLQGAGQLLPEIVDQAARLLRAEGVGIRVREGDELVLVARTEAAAAVMRRPRVKLGEGLAGRVVAEGRPLMITGLGPDTPGVPGPGARARAAGFRAFLGVPMRAGARTVGVLNVYRTAGAPFSEDELSLAAAFADQAAIALENARLYQAQELRATRLRVLAEVSRVISSSLDPAVVLPAIGAAARELMRARAAAFWLADPEARRLRLFATSDEDPEAGEYPVSELSFGQAAAGWVAEHGGRLEIPDIARDERVIGREWWGRRGVSSLLAVPIALDGTLLGVLTLWAGRPFSLDADEERLLDGFVAQAAVAIRNAKLYAASERRRRAAEALAEVGRALAQSLESEAVGRRVVERVGALLHARMAALYRVEPASGDLVFGAGVGEGVEWNERLARGTGTVGRAVGERRLIATSDVLADPTIHFTPDARARIERSAYRAVATVPLCVGERVIGALAVGDRAGRVFDEEERTLLQAFADQAAIALDNARLYDEARTRLARLRQLTELSHLVTSSLDLQAVLEAVAQSALVLVEADLARIWIVDRHAGLLRLGANRGRDGLGSVPSSTQFPLGQGLVGRVIDERQVRYSPRLADDPWQVNKEWVRAGGFVSQIAVPLVVGEQAVGALVVLTRYPRDFTGEERDMLRLFAAKAAVAIENARLYDEVRGRLREARALLEISGALTSTLELAPLLEEVARTTARAVGVTRCSIRLEGDGRLLPAGPPAVDGPADREPGAPAPAAVALPAYQEAVRSRRPVAIRDVTASPLVPASWRATADLRALLVVPLVRKDEVIGTLSLADCRGPRDWSQREVDLALTVAQQVALALDNARLYEAARTALAKLEAKNAELDSFVYMVSHDLKAPLVAIQGMAGLLLQDQAERLDERGRRYLERIGANGAQMERLIGDLLALSRVGREARPPELVAVDEVVDEVLAELGEQLRARGVKVTRGELGTVRAVRTQMQQVWSNLLSNAVKYLGDTAAPRVEIGAVDRGEAVEFRVRDNGIGIDPAYHAQIFELFQRLKEVEAEGTGVGLPIVKKIVEAAGGRIWVESARGQGSTFFFTWPKAERRA